MKKTKPIIIYATTWCGDCIRTKQWLDEHKFHYKEINIEKDKKAMEFVLQTNKGMQSVPTIVLPDGKILVEPTNQQLEESLL